MLVNPVIFVVVLVVAYLLGRYLAINYPDQATQILEWVIKNRQPIIILVIMLLIISALRFAVFQ